MQAMLQDFEVYHDAIPGVNKLGRRSPDIPSSYTDWLIEPTIDLVYGALGSQPLKSDLGFIGRKVFGGWGTEIVTEEGESPKPAYLERANQTKNRVLRSMVDDSGMSLVDRALFRAFYSVISSRYGFLEWTQIRIPDINLYGPGAFQILPWASFNESPPGRSSIEWREDPLMPGVVYHETDERYELWQKYSSDMPPKLVNPGNKANQGVVIIREPSPDEISLIGSVLPIYLGYLIASRRLDQATFKNAGSVVFGKINAAEITSDNPATKNADEKYLKDLKTNLEHILKTWNTRSSAILWPGANLETPNIQFPMDPMDARSYYHKALLETLIPRHMVDTTGSSLTSTGASIMELYHDVATGWRNVIGPPFERILTKLILEANGFRDLRIKMKWKDLSPIDEELQKRIALDSFEAKLIPRSRALSLLGFDPLDDAEIEELKSTGSYSNIGGM